MCGVNPGIIHFDLRVSAGNTSSIKGGGGGKFVKKLFVVLRS